MKKILLMSLILMVTLLQQVTAQNRSISGRVTDRSTGEGLPGVTVLLKGTTNGVSTNSDGTYSLSVPEAGGTLVFSSVGYLGTERQIGSDNQLNIGLATDSKQISEVVVVGYGTQARRDLTGSVATISGKEIATAPVQSFDQAIQGRAAGVNITTPNGVLNNPPIIRIRGVNSVRLSSEPLIVIDGVPTFSGNSSAVGSVPNNPLGNLNPADIESMEVLKDASATAIYGSRAAGGVILVTTKKGKRGQSRVGFDSWAGWSKPVRLYDVLDANQYMMMKNEAVRNLNANRRAQNQPATNIEGFRPSLDANGNQVDTRWYDYIYRTGFSTSNAVNFSGGTEKTTFYTSVGYSNQKGMIKNNEFKRGSVRANIDHKLFKNFNIGVQAGYSNTKNASPNSGSVADGAFGTGGLGRLPLVLPPNVAPRNNDGSYNINPTGNGLGAGANINPTSFSPSNPNGSPLYPGYYNPVVELENNYFTSDGNQVQGSVYANWELVKGLNVRTSYGIDNINFEDRAFYTPISGDGYSSIGQALNYFRANRRWNWQNTAQYDHSFGEKHNFSLLLGNEQQYTTITRWGGNRTGVADPFFTTFEGNFTNIAPSGNFQGENYLLSYFGRFNYDFAKKYLLTVNARRDGYSAWAPGKKYGNFYGASLGYIVSDEEFWKNASFLAPVSLFKITGGIGNVGNFLGVNDFASQQLYASGLYATQANLYYSLAGNPNLTWERSQKSDVALTMAFLENRFELNAAYYRNLVDGLILDVPQAPSKGIPGGDGLGVFDNANRILSNVGSMQNTGFEFSTRINAIQKSNFSWTVNANVTTLKNRVLELATKGQRLSTATSGLETVNFTEVGRSVGEILAVKSVGINPANGRRMIEKRNADGSVTVVQYDHLGTGWTTLDGKPATAPNQAADGVYFGPTLPKWYGGFDNTFRYGGFDLGIFVQFSGGNYIYNGTKAGLHDQRFWNNATDIQERWTETNTEGAKWPRVVFGDNVSNGSALVMSSNVEKGDFARLRNVSLGYSPKSEFTSRFNVSSFRIYAQVQNAALLTKYSGIDPEISTNSGTSANTSAGVDRNSVGQARTYTVGFNIGF